MQEDQMWAMQDYLQQYQQLICRFRSENASLRRQLNDERSGTVVEREPQPATRPQPNWPATGGGPPIQTTPAPGTEKKQVPSPNIEMPDVPPLKQGTSNNSSHRYQSLANHEGGQTESDRYAQLASYEAKVDGAAATSAGDPVAPDASNNLRQNDSTIRDAAATASPDILLTGEVVANDSGGGPRLVIDIEAFDQSGSIARFDGNVSLALLSSEGGVQHRLARWNFGPDEVRSAVDATASEPTMRFRVELPVGTKVEGATELWVRLSPAAGGRLLSHAKLDLRKPGVFSSRADKIWASEESVVAASYVDTSSSQPEVSLTMNEGTWATGKPGKPAILPPETDQATGGWKAASGPLPTVVANTKPTATMTEDRPKRIEPAPAKAAPVEVARKPAWTPERPGASPNSVRPSWLATR